jgi:hypothetical protein
VNGAGAPPDRENAVVPTVIVAGLIGNLSASDAAGLVTRKNNPSGSCDPTHDEPVGMAKTTRSSPE